MVIIRCNALAHEQMLELLKNDIHAQAATGVIVLPNFCELLNEVPADEEICVKYADGVPMYCTGCKYREMHQHFTDTVPWYRFPQTLLCPNFSNDENGPIFCINWPPEREERLV